MRWLALARKLFEGARILEFLSVKSCRSFGRNFVSVYIFYTEINRYLQIYKFGYQGSVESAQAHRITQVTNDKSAVIYKKIGNILLSLVALPLSL